MKPLEHWRTKMRAAVEAEAVNILGVTGIISAIYRWREMQAYALGCHHQRLLCRTHPGRFED